MFSPDTNLRLLSTPLEADGLNTLWFPDVQTQTNYFLNKTVEVVDNEFNYTKRDENVVIIAGTPEQYYNINYVMYQNENFSTKWFYAFVIGIQWVSMGSVRLILAQDCVQTWLFDLQYYQSFIVRQHSVTDIPGDNIVPEPIAGSNLIYDQKASQELDPSTIVVLATCDPDGNPIGGQFTAGGVTYSGCGILVRNKSNITDTLNQYVQNGMANGVVGIYCMPWIEGDKEISRYPATIDTYSPVNNKLRTGAFIEAYCSGMGQEISFNPTEGTSATIWFRFGSQPYDGTFSVGVRDYGMGRSVGVPENNSQFSPVTLTIQFPKSTWAYNQYQNDYNLHSGSNFMNETRLGHQQFLAPVNGILNVIGGMATTVQNAAAAIGSGGAEGVSGTVSGLSRTISGVTDTLEAIQGVDTASQALQTISENLRAPATGLSPNSTAYTTLNWFGLSFGFKVPPKDIAKRYDDYLTMYGYAQSNFGVPNIHARKSFTFVQVSELNASGNFPDSDMGKIKQLFQKGIRFWVHTATFGDYTQGNGVL